MITLFEVHQRNKYRSIFIITFIFFLSINPACAPSSYEDWHTLTLEKTDKAHQKLSGEIKYLMNKAEEEPFVIEIKLRGLEKNLIIGYR